MKNVYLPEVVGSGIEERYIRRPLPTHDDLAFTQNIYTEKRPLKRLRLVQDLDRLVCRKNFEEWLLIRI